MLWVCILFSQPIHAYYVKAHGTYSNYLARYYFTLEKFIEQWSRAENLVCVKCEGWNSSLEKILITDTLDSLTEKERGPLYGIPFSVKEHFFIKGKDSTVGLYSRIGQPATENAQIGK